MMLTMKWSKAMTNSKFTLACFAIVAAASCAKESANTNLSPRSYEAISVSGISQESKTHIGSIEGNVAHIEWSANDALSLFSTAEGMTSDNTLLSGTSYNGKSATFEGEVESGTTSFIALYPYNANANYNSGVLSTSIPTAQTATEGSFSNGVALAIAVGEKRPGVVEVPDGLSFGNLCSVLSFKLPANIDFAEKITISTKSEAAMAGNVTIDCTSGTITSASASTVELSGSFVPGGTYYVSVAPGTYENGFTFRIDTKGGNSYSRETTKTVNALSGGIYPLGTLSLALSETDFSSSIGISHIVEGGVLYGSSAKFTLNCSTAEFSSLVTIKSVSVNLYDGATTYRTLNMEGSSFNAVEMNAPASLPYLPKGNYNYDLTVNYTVNNGSKDVERSVTYVGKTSSRVPEGMVLDAKLTGYTSYSCYKGTDGQSASPTNANSKDGSTIYGIGASYKSGLSAAVYSQCSSRLSIRSTLDGAVVSGNAGGQTWAAHTIGAKMSFDGSAETTAATTATVHVTGLPYNIKNEDLINTRDYWSVSGGKSEWKDNYLYFGNGTANFIGNGTANFKGFHIPADIKTTLAYNIHVYAASLFNDITTTLAAGGNQIFSEKVSGTAANKDFKSTTTIVTFTSANNTISIKAACKTPPTWLSSHVQARSIGVTYL